MERGDWRPSPLTVSVTVVVAADTGCQWTVTGLPLWLTVTSGASGVGGGTVTLEAAPNLFPGARAVVSQEAGIPGAIDVANNSVSASQTGTLGDVPAARH